MPSQQVKDAWRNYDIDDGGFMKRHELTQLKYREMLDLFMAGDHRPVMDAMQLIISKAAFLDWLIINLDKLLNERGITVVLSTNGQYVVSNESETLRWFDNPASAYNFALEQVLNAS